VNPDKDVDAAAALNLSRLLLDGLARFDEKKHRGAPAAVAAVLEVRLMCILSLSSFDIHFD